MNPQYDNLPDMYRAELVAGDLNVVPVTGHIYMRIGTAGLNESKIGAIEDLKLRMMNIFQMQMKQIDWQANKYIRESIYASD